MFRLGIDPEHCFKPTQVLDFYFSVQETIGPGCHQSPAVWVVLLGRTFTSLQWMLKEMTMNLIYQMNTLAWSPNQGNLVQPTHLKTSGNILVKKDVM